MRPLASSCVHVICLLGVASPAAEAQNALRSELVASGLEDPLYVTHAPGDFDRLFIVERGGAGPGRISIMDLDSGVVLPTPFLEVSVGLPAGEEGLFSLAFHPDYNSDGYFYICHTTPGPGLFVIARYHVSGNPNVANP